MIFPSFSQLDLADHCQFPQLSNLRPSKGGSREATFGTCVHEAAQCLAVWGDAPIDAIGDELGDERDVDKLTAAYLAIGEHLIESDDKWRMTEVPVAIDLKTGGARALSIAGKRRYRVTPDERPGTIDLVRQCGDKLIVTDYKTGWYRRFTAPMDDLQLLAGGICAARIWKADSVTIEFWHVDDEVHVVQAELDAMMLDWAWERLTKVYAKFDEWQNAVPKPGVWCKDGFCKVVGNCPATTSAINATLQVARTKYPMVPEIKDDDHARFILERLPAVKKAAKLLEDALKERYDLQPLDLLDGRRWGKVESVREKILVNDQSEAVLRQALGGSFIDKVVTKRITKAAVASAVKEVAPKGGATALNKSIMEQLEAVSAIQVTPYSQFKTVKVKE